MKPLILIIDCSSESAFVALSEGEKLLGIKTNNIQKEHASFLHEAIDNLLRDTVKTVNEIDAISVISGPGSYTGLRVAFASAKGLAYALGKPLITISSLKLLAFAAFLNTRDKEGIYVPMLDARRLEVFTATLNSSMEYITPEKNLVLDPSSFSDINTEKTIYFFGSGAIKFQSISNIKTGKFLINVPLEEAGILLSNQEYHKNKFEEIFSASPNYIKPFHDGN